MEDELFWFTTRQEIKMFLRILMATGIGALIGYERRRTANAAGVRTLALVAMGAAVFTVISVHGFEEFGTVRDPRVWQPR